MEGERMQSLGLQEFSSRKLETPENETESQYLNRLMTQEIYGRDPQRVVAFLYQFAALVILVAGYEFKLLGGIPGVVLWTIIGAFTVKGARAGTPNAVRKVLKAGTFPILYLRPFVADNEKAANPIPFLWVRTPEKQTVNLFRNRLRCPVVAVADPSEELGSLGALRVWINHEYWQEKVRDFMRCAPLVILAIKGSSDSLNLDDRSGSLWELKVAVELADPTRLLILLPRKNRGGIELTLNRFLPKPISNLWSKAQLLAFDSNWNPIEVDAPRGVLPRYHPVRKVSDSLMSDRQSLAEVDELVGPSLPEWRRILYTIVHPTRTFEDIERGNHRWWPPFLLLAAAWVCLVAAIGARGGFSHTVGDDEGFLQLFLSSIFLFIALVWFCAACLVLKWTVNGLFRGTASWSATVAVWMYAQLPLAFALSLAAAFIRWFPGGNLGFTHFSAEDLAVISGPWAPHQWALFVVAFAVHLWFVILLSLGVAKIADVKVWAGFSAVLPWDLLFYGRIFLSWLLTRGAAPHT
jgi:hypothetical protein